MYPAPPSTTTSRMIGCSAPIPSLLVPAVTALTSDPNGEPDEPLGEDWRAGALCEPPDEDWDPDPAEAEDEEPLPLPLDDPEPEVLDGDLALEDTATATTGAVASAAAAAALPFAPSCESVWRV
jgi:hypothetical protein